MPIEIAYQGVAPFHSLSVEDRPTVKDFKNLAQSYMVALSNWGDPDPDHLEEFGSAVTQLGKLAGYMGKSELLDESIVVAPAYSSGPFGPSSNICTNMEAMQFAAKCINAANGLEGKVAEQEIQLCDGVPMRSGYAQALLWDRHARTRFGATASVAQVHKWCLSRRDEYPEWKLPKKQDTFRKYVSEAKRIISEARQLAGVGKLPPVERAAYKFQGK